MQLRIKRQTGAESKKLISTHFLSLGQAAVAVTMLDCSRLILAMSTTFVYAFLHRTYALNQAGGTSCTEDSPRKVARKGINVPRRCIAHDRLRNLKGSAPSPTILTQSLTQPTGKE